MDSATARRFIQTIRDERQRRASELAAGQDEYFYEVWEIKEQPFIDELSLLLMVAIRHEFERDILRLAAAQQNPSAEITYDVFMQNVNREQRGFRKPEYWKALKVRLNCASLAAWRSMETLRHLSNSYKHNPWGMPQSALRKHLGLDENLNYAQFAESEAVRRALAQSLGLTESAAYFEIAEAFLRDADSVVAHVRASVPLAKVKRSPVSLHPDDSAY